MRRLLAVLGAILLGIVTTATAGLAAADFDQALLGALHEQERDGVTVRTAVPDARQVEAIFGYRVIEKGVQPVYVEIENSGDEPLWYMPITTDETYFAPLEVAWRFRDPIDPTSGTKAAEVMTRLAVPLSVPARGSVSGFVFTHLETGLKFLTFGMLKGGDEIAFRFIVPVTGPAYLGEHVDFGTMYKPGELRDVDLAGLRAAIAAMPCCTTNEDGSRKGDPLNVVVVGDLAALFAFVDRGWRMTQMLDLHSAVDTAKSFVLGTTYDTSPVSPLYLFGRPEDLALQKARATIDERNHVRFWLTPLRFQGKDVWIGQISRDIGVELTRHSWYLTTHRISPSVDFDRDYLLQDLLLSGAVAHFGYAAGVGVSPASDPRTNLTDDPYVTDGLRLVLMISGEDDPIGDVDDLEWEKLPAPAP